MRIVGLIPVLALGCVEATVSSFDTPPAVSIVSPVDEEVFAPGAVIEFVGVVTDDLGPNNVTASWLSSVDGALGDVFPNADGDVYLALNTLTGGDHVITLSAVDAADNSDEESVAINVGYGDTEEGAPTVLLLGPVDNETYMIEDQIMFVGTVSDDEDAAETIATKLSSSRDGIFWTGFPDTTGSINVPWSDLSVGVHNITLTAEDSDGKVATDGAASVEVLNDGRPYVDITAPASYDTYWLDDSITFEGSVTDDESDNETLIYEWRSDVDGDLGNGNPTSVGWTGFATTELSAATHVITLSALDEDNKVGSDSIIVEVLDPLDVDQDADGYTPNQGDCDDGNPNINPAEPEICDTMDNDCDGDVNEDWADIYEWNTSSVWSPNDDAAHVYDLGSVDSILWSGSTVTLSGLTFHHEDDEDWFFWNAEDEILLDNVNINATIQLPTSGSYTAVLYLVEGSRYDFNDYQLKQSATGSGVLSLSFTGDTWNGDEDDWV
ncbi:MAG: hypothetical protein HN348_05885, partial [Proteobacteria bacterium]|nr:hypothetical protein [Pseudomonadota bacterium]